jgi:uncharacterized protein
MTNKGEISMPVEVTGLYAGLLALLMIILNGRIGAIRGKKDISLGDKGDVDIIVAIRQHMNFVENVPFILLLMGLAELDGAPKFYLHILGATLLFARIIHPFGLNQEVLMKPARLAGAGLTPLVTLGSAVLLLWQAVGG